MRPSAFDTIPVDCEASAHHGEPMIERRAIVAGMLGAATVAAGARAQAPRSAKIGYLHPTTISSNHFTLTLLRRQWQQLGYVEGVNVFLRSADGDNARLPALIDELIRLDVGVLIVVGAAPLKAASRATRTVPIVAIDMETDPVYEGFAASVSRPGANITGLFLDQPSLAGKWVQLLREAAPTIRRLALLWDNTTGRHQLEAAIMAARAEGIETAVVEARPADQYDAAFHELAKGPPTGLVQLAGPGTAPTFAAVAQSAIAHRLPGITFLKTNVKSGVLMGYGPIQETYFPQAVAMADRILKGAKAGELPIQRPTGFELTINLRTAKALALTIPPALLIRADEVFE
jgi:putative tryptophan/tyrosine transport system substrate-binding protein